MEHLINYFQRFHTYPPQIATSPPNDLAFTIVIPSYNEPNVIQPLQSLWKCKPPNCKGEVIIHINCTKNASATVKSQNKESLKQIQEWEENHPHNQLSFYTIYSEHLPEKDAGPGLARKIGMDEAVRRFKKVNQPEGAIISLDADCKVSSNYLQALEEEFINTSSVNACNIYFEHPIQELADNKVQKGIINYELFLRYYRHALRYVGFPFPYHTIGSCMGVKARVYAKQGGMNKNKGGEDFYFLHKIFPLGHFKEINSTTVYPAARLSERVPYGTGKAITNWVQEERQQFTTYPVKQFEDLKQFLDKVNKLYKLPLSSVKPLYNTLPPAIKDFLKQENFWEKLEEIKKHTSQRQTFKQRFFNWFDGMMVLKFCYFGLNYYYKATPLTISSSQLLQKMSLSPGYQNNSPLQLLQYYRGLDKNIEQL